MRFEHVPAEEMPKALAIGKMRASFRNLSSKERDLRGLTHWYKAKEERVKQESALRDRLYHSEKAHRERQESGQYPAISRDDLDRMQGANYEVNESFDAEAKARLERFISGTSDNINDMLFTPLQANADEPLSQAAASIDEQQFTEIVYDEPAVETTHTSDMDVVAKLEDAIKLNSVGGDEEIVPVSLPASHYVSESAETNESDTELPLSLSARLVRTAKVTPLRGRTRKQK